MPQDVATRSASKQVDRAAWNEARIEIISRVDVQAEYLRWGAQLASNDPNEDGWVSCHAIGRDDKTPSAGINIGHGPHRGNYRDFTDTSGNGSLTFFYAAARFGGFADTKAAVKHYADLVGVDLPGGSDPTDFEQRLDFLEWRPSWARQYEQNKVGVTAAALERMGARCARYPKKSSDHQSVYALPIYGPALIDGDPCGWVVIHAFGRQVMKFEGKGRAPRPVKSMSIKGSRGGLMNRAALTDIRTAEVVWKVEGVTDCIALDSIIPDEFRGRHIVVTNSQGASEVSRADILKHFAGKTVNVIHDADKPGSTGAARWVAALASAGAAAKHVRLPYPETDDHGKDLRDWLTEGPGRTYEELLKLADEFMPVVESEADDIVEREICERLALEILGEHHTGIMVYSRHHHKVANVKDIDHIGVAKIRQICGAPARDAIREKPLKDGDDEDDGKISLFDVRTAIAHIAGKRRLEDSSLNGPGCWGVDGHAIAIVNGGRSAVWNGSKKLEPNTTPICRGKILDLSNAEPWCDFLRLESYLRRAADPAWCKSIYEEARAIFARLLWRGPLDADICLSLVIATYVQTLWEWRPQVGILGESGSGKTTLFGLLMSIWGKFCIPGEKPTEAGLRQLVGNSSKAVLIDEFEADRHRQAVLDLIRTSSRGESSAILRGTQDQRGKRFSLRHICWCAAIEIGLTRDPDRNRFIQLELVKPPRPDQGKFRAPDANYCEDLGHKLLAIAIENVWRAKEMVLELRSGFQGVPDRVVECYSVPAAMMATACGMDVQEAREFMGLVFENGDMNEINVADQEQLIQSILSSEIILQRGERATVASILAGECSTEGAARQLESNGIAKVSLSDGNKKRRDTIDWMMLDGISIVQNIVKQKLLKGTGWEHQSIDTVLLRLKGAKRGQRTIMNQKLRTVDIPISSTGLDMVEPREF